MGQTFDPDLTHTGIKRGKARKRAERDKRDAGWILAKIEEGTVSSVIVKKHLVHQKFRFFILKVTDIENEKYALVAPVIANTNPLRYDDAKMFCIKVQGENGFETVKDKNVIRTLVELWSN